mmetsp:Transcript_5904/g.15561  ORF Transcript_5904/g.15561 Transcript_5904/m.15561 type:complete len:288 (-) Transcript_5904:37-900(-)
MSSSPRPRATLRRCPPVVRRVKVRTYSHSRSLTASEQTRARQWAVSATVTVSALTCAMVSGTTRTTTHIARWVQPVCSLGAHGLALAHGISISLRSQLLLTGLSRCAHGELMEFVNSSKLMFPSPSLSNSWIMSSMSSSPSTSPVPFMTSKSCSFNSSRVMFPLPSVSKSLNASTSSPGSSMSFILLSIKVQNSVRSIAPDSSLSTSFMISCSSSSVGFWPRDSKTAPSSFSVIVPPPSVSKRRKACSRSEIISSVNVSIDELSGPLEAADSGTTRCLRGMMPNARR